MGAGPHEEELCSFEETVGFVAIEIDGSVLSLVLDFRSLDPRFRFCMKDLKLILVDRVFSIGQLSSFIKQQLFLQ